MTVDTADIIFAILKYLEESLDEEKIDYRKINEKSLGISYPRYCRVLGMMIDEELITGLAPVNVAGSTYTQYKFINPSITLKGIEYLNQNKPSAKVYKILKEIKDWIPGI
ncbi:YjcQ family protein [Heyndrickxia oleronia]|uniref:YjcQ family protein n=1 Tax=Heyndrickxia oleronia TaxID=38875 RepID=UPI001C0ED7A1|nr:YjcQ family protein [Heyndrickxia oleronia]MBU5214942.1 YjcQ family protein [Heyndrickxia oleronia]